MLLLRMMGLFIMFSPSLCEILDVLLSVEIEAKLYRLQCDVFSAAPPQNLTVNWYKNNEIVNTTFFETTTTKVNISDILKADVTREENVTQFRCEALLEGPRAPQLESQTRSLSALYAPEFRTNHSAHITVPSGGVVSLTCEADGNPPPEYQWAFNGTNLSTNSHTINVTEDDGGAYSCTAVNDLGNTILNVYVHAPEVTTSPPAALPTPEEGAPRGCILTVMPSKPVVKFGDPVEINCSTSSPHIDKLGWESTVGGFSEHSPYVLWRVAKVEDFNLNPTCFGTLIDDSQCTSTPHMTIYKTPDFVSVSAVDHGPMKDGSEYQLKCDIHNVAPAQNVTVKWYHGNKTVCTECPKTSPPPIVTPLNVSSILKVPVKKGDNGSHFICVAELHLGPSGPEPPPSAASEPYIADVHYKPAIKNCQPKRPVVENKFSMNDMSCTIDANPPPTVQWYRGDLLISSSEPLKWTESGIYRAEVSNDMGSSSTSVRVTVEHSPRFSCKMQYEVDVKEKPKTLCEPDGSPSPNITWFKNGKKMALPQSWSKHDSGNYSLKAHNEHGTAEHRFYLDVMYAPEFKEGDVQKDLIPDGNETFPCSAEGNPSPEIKWIYKLAHNLKETTEGRQKIITVTRATSTNAGSYICVATNKFGNVTRTVTLQEKGKTSNNFIYWVLILLLFIILGLFIFIIIRKRKHGRYSFVSKSDESSIPMTTNGSKGN